MTSPATSTRAAGNSGTGNDGSATSDATSLSGHHHQRSARIVDGSS
jgi:hypothetical protein